MSYITEIFDRLDLQQIREFLLHGVECYDVSGDSYKQRLEAAEKPVIEMIEEKFEENDEIAGDIHHYATVNQNVYMEIGLRCGAVLAAQLLSNPKKDNINQR